MLLVFTGCKTSFLIFVYKKLEVGFSQIHWESCLPTVRQSWVQSAGGTVPELCEVGMYSKMYCGSFVACKYFICCTKQCSVVFVPSMDVPTASAITKIIWRKKKTIPVYNVIMVHYCGREKCLY